jgi:phenylalanyl-tRNA synthetase beta chain
LRAIGLRPISALVDITNYVTFDLNRPLHVFDAGKLQGNLTLRFARPGEQLLALDGRTYELHDSVTVIADESGPQALGGVMGGERSGCTGDTTDVLLEVALFDPIRTAMTGRALGIESDARTRFERGLDPEMVLPGMEHATRLILDLCGGEAAPAVIAGEVPRHDRTIEFPLAELTRLGGITLGHADAERYLKSLGFEIEGHSELYRLRPPSWRGDVTTSACIVEELCRLHGYDQIPPVPVARTEAVGQVVLTSEQQRRQGLRRAVAADGFAEAVTWSFTEEKLATLFGGTELAILSNPINSELAVMRPSLLPNLLAAASRNVAHRRDNGALFELGPRFTGSRPGDQVMAVAGIRYG